MLLRAFAVWWILLVAAVANGAFREAWIVPRLGNLAGHVVSTLLLCALIVAIAWFTIDWVSPDRTAAALAIGALWLALTVAFEFGAGHYLFGAPWEALLADYDASRGRVWPLVLVATLLAPLVAGWGRGLVR